MDQTYGDLKHIAGIYMSAYGGLVNSLGYEYHDVISWGWLGVEEAKRKYDPSLGCSLRTYTCNVIRWRIKDEIIKLGIRPSGVTRIGRGGRMIRVDYSYWLEHQCGQSSSPEYVVLLKELQQILPGVASKRDGTIFMKRIIGYKLKDIAKKHRMSFARIFQITRNVGLNLRKAAYKRSGND